MTPTSRDSETVSTRSPAATTDREIVTTRLIDAPPALVFKTWTDPEHVAEWWGPNGFTNTILEMDVRPGGVWRFIMHGPNGVDYPNKIVYEEVVFPERLVYRHGSGEDDGSDDFETTVTFVEQDGKTLLTMRAVLASPEALAEVMKFGAVEGGQQTIDRLEAYLRKSP